MVASSIPCKLSLCADRAHACAGDSHVSSAIDVACPTTQNVLAIASPHELQGDSWPSSSTGTSSFCCNQQYSITAVTTSTGSIAERYAYSAYGQPTILDASASVLSNSAINNRYTYTGREWDATLGLHHFRARWMSPNAGRFLTRDPIGYKDGLALYASRVTLRFLDPSGMKLEISTKHKKKCSGCGEFRVELDHRIRADKPGEVGEFFEAFLIQKICITKKFTSCSCPPRGTCKPVGKERVCTKCVYEMLGYVTAEKVQFERSVFGDKFDAWALSGYGDGVCVAKGSTVYTAELKLLESTPKLQRWWNAAKGQPTYFDLVDQDGKDCGLFKTNGGSKESDPTIDNFWSERPPPAESHIEMTNTFDCCPKLKLKEGDLNCSVDLSLNGKQ